MQDITSKKPEFTFFPSAHGTFSRTDHIPGHKTNLNKFKSVGIISSIFSDHNAMKLEINHRKRNGKNNYMETKHHATKKKWVNEEMKNYLVTNDRQ